MLCPGAPFLLALGLYQALSLPLTTQLPEGDEKVTKCITEILVDTLSKPSPIPATSDCLEVLREDERVLAVLHHQHLLAELEELAHQENTKHHLTHEGGRDGWEGKDEGEEEKGVKKRSEKPKQQREATSEKIETQKERRKEEDHEEQGYEKVEKTEEKEKEEKVSRGEEDEGTLEEQVKALMEQEKREEEEKEARKKRSSSETWSSKEYFGHLRSRGPGQPKIWQVMLRGDQDGGKRSGSLKRHLRLEEEEEEESSEEEPRKSPHGGHDRARRPRDWEEEEEEGEERKAELAKRVAEKTSDEETDQFEEEEKGPRLASGHLHGGWKPWGEDREGEWRHGHHHGLDLVKRRQKDTVSLQDRRHGHEGDEEDRGADPKEVLDLEKLEEIEQELKSAAEKLEELRKG